MALFKRDPHPLPFRISRASMLGFDLHVKGVRRTVMSYAFYDESPEAKLTSFAQNQKDAKRLMGSHDLPVAYHERFDSLYQESVRQWELVRKALVIPDEVVRGEALALVVKQLPIDEWSQFTSQLEEHRDFVRDREPLKELLDELGRGSAGGSRFP